MRKLVRLAIIRIPPQQRRQHFPCLPLVAMQKQIAADQALAEQQTLEALATQIIGLDHNQVIE